MQRHLLAFILVLGSFQCSFAQIKHPKISPFSEVSQDIGLTTISVQYSRPSKRGRDIIGGLVPYDRIWRVGANESTKFTTSHRIEIAGNQLEKGTYALYAIPHKDQWEIIIHGNTAHWGDGRDNYRPEEDIFRFVATPEKIPFIQENFLIGFDKITHNGAVMQWVWEDTKINIPIVVDTHSIMLAEIESRLAHDPTGMTYYEAARYLQEQGEQPEKALLWLDKAQALNGSTYYFHRVRSLVLASQGKYKTAIKEARRSLKIADSLGKDEFVRMNQKNIDSWSDKL